MFALPVVRVTPNSQPEFFQGLLFSLPTDLRGKTRIAEYADIQMDGWHKDQFGYYIYRRTNNRGHAYIFPGLYLIDPKNSVRKKIHGFQRRLTKHQIENYANQIVQRELNFQREIEGGLESVVHDTRRLSTAIHYQATEALEELKKIKGKKYAIEQHLRSVIASQTILKVRTDLLDYTGAIPVGMESEEIAIFRRADKVVRCYRPLADDLDVTIDISGSSYASSLGPDVSEVIFYILIDNAVKYSPVGEIIRVVITESDDHISVNFYSIGPRISRAERDRIFAKGVRGKYAVASGASGNGLGLHLARDLIELFGGTLEFKADRPYNDEANPPLDYHYFSAKFPVSIRDYTERYRRPKKSQNRNNRRKKFKKAKYR